MNNDGLFPLDFVDDTVEEEEDLDDFSPGVKTSALPFNKLEDDLL